MIDDEAVVERLRRAHAVEPAPKVDPVVALRAGRRWRRRRTVTRWSGVAAASAGALAFGAGLAGGWGWSPDRAVDPVTEDVPAFTAVTVLDAYAGVPEGVPDPFGGDADDASEVGPWVDLEAGTVTLWTGGSYSCPTWPKAIRGYSDTVEIVVGLPDGVDPCTADFRATTYVVALPSGYAPDVPPTVRVISQGPDGVGAGVPTDLPADDATGCRPALTVCAMNRWLDDMLTAAGYEPLGYVSDPLAGGDAVRVGGELIWLTLAPPERARGRMPMQVQGTNDVGAVVVEHGTDFAGDTPAAAFTCGGIRIQLSSDPTMPADVLAQAADAIAATISQCPADLDELLASYPDLSPR